MHERSPRSQRFALGHRGLTSGPHPTPRERLVQWADFRAAVRFDPTSRLLVAVPAISAKRAEHPWLGEARAPHTRIGVGEVVRREYEHGAVYWSDRTGAHEVHGEIAEAWRLAGAESSFLGLPVTDELPFGASPGADTGWPTGASTHASTCASAPTGDGYAHFEGGSIYRTARHGTAIVHGMVRDIWALLGWERSALGAPVADVVVDSSTATMSGCFERGIIEWSPQRGPVVTITAPAASAALICSPVGGDALDRLHADFAPRP